MNLIDNNKEFKKIIKKGKIEDLINLCLENEYEVIELVLKNWLSDENNSLNEYREKITDIGSLCSGTVYLPEYTYVLTGFILKRERKVHEELYKDYWFMPVYIEGNANLEEDPLVFQNCCNIYDDHGFVSDTFGNFIHLEEVLTSKDMINKYIKSHNIDLNKVLKNHGIYLGNNSNE